jgi:hypothetical protein
MSHRKRMDVDSQSPEKTAVPNTRVVVVPPLNLEYKKETLGGPGPYDGKFSLRQKTSK